MEALRPVVVDAVSNVCSPRNGSTASLTSGLRTEPANARQVGRTALGTSGSKVWSGSSQDVPAGASMVVAAAVTVVAGKAGAGRVEGARSRDLEEAL